MPPLQALVFLLVGVGLLVGGELAKGLTSMPEAPWGADPRSTERLRKRKWSEPFLEAYRSRMLAEVWNVEVFLESEPIDHGFSEFFASLYWSTTWETQGGFRVRPPGREPGLLYFCLAIDAKRLDATIGWEAFDFSAVELMTALGAERRGGIMVDVPWHMEGPFTEGFGQGGPTVARMNLFARAPHVDDAVDLDHWSPEFDIPF